MPSFRIVAPGGKKKELQRSLQTRHHSANGAPTSTVACLQVTAARNHYASSWWPDDAARKPDVGARPSALAGEQAHANHVLQRLCGIHVTHRTLRVDDPALLPRVFVGHCQPLALTLLLKHWLFQFGCFKVDVDQKSKQLKVDRVDAGRVRLHHLGDKRFIAAKAVHYQHLRRRTN